MNGPQVVTEVQVVRDFLRALERLDIDHAVALLGDEVVYQNVPLPAARGRRAVATQLGWLGRHATAFEARIHNIAADGSVVLTERTDVLARGRFRAEFWVCGTFEVRDGKVVLWRDYFDYADVTWAMVKGAARALVARASERR